MILWLGWQDLGVTGARLGILYFERPGRMKDFPIIAPCYGDEKPHRQLSLAKARRLETSQSLRWIEDRFNVPDGISSGPGRPRKDLQEHILHPSRTNQPPCNREDPTPNITTRGLEFRNHL